VSSRHGDREIISASGRHTMTFPGSEVRIVGLKLKEGEILETLMKEGERDKKRGKERERGRER
jgi:hypothetical protein